MNIIKWREWCNPYKNWISDQWKTVLRSDESTSHSSLPPVVYVWRTSQEYDPNSLMPQAKHEGGYVMIRAGISWYHAGPLITMNDIIIARDFGWLGSSNGMNGGQWFRDYFLGVAPFKIRPQIHTFHIIQSWFDKRKDEVSCLPWTPQSPELNI